MFMKHLYSKYKKEYIEHRERFNYDLLKRYNLTIDELLEKQELTNEQMEYIDKYNKYNPLLETDCTMNNICRHIEENIKEIKIHVKRKNDDEVFQMLFNDNIEITNEEIDLMHKQYKKYQKNQTDENLNNINSYSFITKDTQKLANLAVYICYKIYLNGNKNFVWDIFGNGVILNLDEKHNSKIQIPIEDISGDIEYRGSFYDNKEIMVEL